MITPSYFPVKQGLLQGARCPVSLVTFVSQNPGDLDDLIQASLAFTADILRQQDGEEPRWRSLESRRNLYNQTKENQ